MYPRARAATSLTSGSNSSRQLTSDSRAPALITHLARCSECLATDRNTYAAAFLYDLYPGAQLIYVLLREGEDQMGEDVVGHDVGGEVLRVVGKTAQGDGGGLLDAWDVIQQQRPKKAHNVCEG